MKKRRIEAKYFGLVITFCLIISLLFFKQGITAFVINEVKITDASTINITFSDPNPANNARLNSTSIIINVSVSENVSLCRLKIDYLSNPILNKTIGGASGNTYGVAVMQTSDGGYVVGAYGDSYGAGGNDFWIVGLNSSLSIIWNKTYGGSDDERLYEIKNTSDGGYVLIGDTESFGNGADSNPDVWIVKVNSTGGHQWNNTYGIVANTETGVGGQQTSDGGYIIGGYMVKVAQQDYWLIKTNSTGGHQWNNTFGTSEHDIATTVQQTNEGGYIIGGYSDGLGLWGNGMLFVRTNTSGGQIWNVTFGEGDSSNNTYGYSLVQTKENEYVAVGDRWVGGEDQPQQIKLVKINASGNVSWNMTYAGSAQCSGQKVIQTTDGGFAISGWYGASGFIGLGSTIWLIKTNASGNVDWNVTFGQGSESAKGLSIAQTSDGWYAITGMSLPDISSGSSAWILKMNSTTQTYTSAFEFNMTNYNGGNRTSARYNLSGINESSYSYYVLCNDSANETNSSLRRSMIIDRTSPNITILTPLAGQSFIIENYNLTVSMTTDEASTCRYNLTNSTFNFNTEGGEFSTTGGTVHTFYYVITLDTQYSIYYKCADSTGNIPSSGKNHTFTLNSYPAGNSGAVGVIIGGGGSSGSSSSNSNSACSDECSSGNECTGNGYKSCGNYDSDSCLEWSEASSCGSNEVCMNGECKATCTNACSENEKECTGNGYKSCGNYDSDSCLEWSEASSCGSNEVCMNGECKLNAQESPQGVLNNLVSSFSSCTPNWKCGNWSECSGSLDARIVLSENLSKDIRERVCTDQNECKAPIVERKECEREATPINVKTEKGINSFNFNIYSKETGKLLAKISQFLENKKLDILIEGF